MMMEQEAYSVSQVNAYLKHRVVSDEALRGIFVKGEISNFLAHPKLGHLYFTLKDSSCAIKAVMFKGNRWRLKFMPENGMKVILMGNVNVFERDGIFQIVAEEIQPDGVGALHAAYEQLKEKLAAKGYFAPEHKRPIPALPRRIGVITAKSGAAVRDILHIIERRYPVTQVVVLDTLVQGIGAAASLCRAMEQAQTLSLDVIILGRGGGSLEDLWAFNDENLAQRVYESRVPVISAVGHETDFTICDFVADLRAPTPSAAAELAVPDQKQLRLSIDNQRNLLYNKILETLTGQGKNLAQLSARLAAYSPRETILHQGQMLDNLKVRLIQSQKGMLAFQDQRFRHAVSALQAVSPMQTVARGYTISLREDGRPIRSVRGLKPGMGLTTRVGDGEIFSTIQEIKKAKKQEQDNLIKG